MDWSHKDYLWIFVMFISAVWTLILTAPIHCGDPLVSKGCNAKLLQILDGLRISTFSPNFHFGLTIPFKCYLRLLKYCISES